jgi:hypothetical protein
LETKVKFYSVILLNWILKFLFRLLIAFSLCRSSFYLSILSKALRRG